MKSYKRYVQVSLDYRDGLQLLAEEAAELAQAALKLIRAGGYTSNLTPITEDEAEKRLLEEIGDVLMTLQALEIDLPDVENSSKWERWAKRLGAD